MHASNVLRLYGEKPLHHVHMRLPGTKEFFKGLADITGGRYLGLVPPLNYPNNPIPFSP